MGGYIDVMVRGMVKIGQVGSGVLNKGVSPGYRCYRFSAPAGSNSAILYPGGNIISGS